MIDCIVMAGGRGGRMGGVEKPLLRVCGVEMVVRVVRGVGGVCRRTLVAYSPWTRGVGDLCRGALAGAECVMLGGSGYVDDLREALEIYPPPVLVLPSDTPFIRGDLVEWFINVALMEPADIVNLVDRRRGPVGIALFKRRSGSWSDVEVDWGRALIDVDTWADYVEALGECL